MINNKINHIVNNFKEKSLIVKSEDGFIYDIYPVGENDKDVNLQADWLRQQLLDLFNLTLDVIEHEVMSIKNKSTKNRKEKSYELERTTIFLRKTGKTLSQIAEMTHVSKQRIHQILNK